MRTSESEGPKPIETKESPFSYIDAFVRGQREYLLLARTPKKFCVSLIADTESRSAYVAHYLTPAFYRENPLMDLSVAHFDLEQAKSYALRLVSSWTREARGNLGKGNGNGSALPTYSFIEDSPINYPQWIREDGMAMNQKEIFYCNDMMGSLLDVGNMVSVDDVIGLFSSAESSEQR